MPNGKTVRFFHVGKGWATPRKAFAFPNPEADAIGSRQQSLFRRIAPYESPYLHHACRTGKPFGFFMSARDGLRPERLSPFRTPRLTRLARGSNRFSVALLLTNPLISTTHAERENRSVFSCRRLYLLHTKLQCSKTTTVFS